MEKEMYFAKVDLMMALHSQLEAHKEEWNAYTCWFGTEEEKAQNEQSMREVNKRLWEIRSEMFEARKDIPEETLKAWSKEYHSRP